MANHPSADKRNRQRITRTERNRAVKATVRTKVKAARGATGATAEAKALQVAAVSALDKASSKGVIHPKTAARKKSRLARAAHKATLAAAKA